VADPAEDRRRALYQAYLDVPVHQRAEIVAGTLYVSPRPAPPHTSATSVLGGELNAAFQRGRGGPGGWWILDEPELQLVAFEPVIPDLAGWRVERMPELPDTPYFTLVPDWVCEVLSPSSERIDRGEKLDFYEQQAVRFVWLVDPRLRTLEVLKLGDHGRWLERRTHQGDARVRAEPFDAIELELGALWARPRTP